MMRPTPPKPSTILEELAGDVLAPMDRGAVSSFSEALDSTVDFHAFLLQVYAKTDSYELAKGGSPPLYKQWNRQYHRIFERAADMLGREPYFFKRAAKVPRDLVKKTAKNVPNVPSEILNDLLELAPFLFFRGKDWWLRHVAKEMAGKRPNIHNPASLSGYEAEIYKDAIYEFASIWKYFWLFKNTKTKEREIKPPTPADQWKQLCASKDFIWRHLYRSAYMLAEAVWRGDKVASDTLSDEALLIWPEGFAAEYVPKTDFKTALLNPYLLEYEWDCAQTEATGLVLLCYKELNPQEVFNAIVKNWWVYVVLILSTQIISWICKENGADNSFLLKISKKLLLVEVKGTIKGFRGKSLSPDNPLEEVMVALINLYLIEERSKDDSHCSWLFTIIAEIDLMRKRPDGVAPHIWDGRWSGGSPGLLMEPQLAILMSLVYLDNQSHNYLKTAISLIIQQAGCSELIRDLIKKFQERLMGMEEEKWLPVLEGLSDTGEKIEDYDERKSAVEGLLEKIANLVKPVPSQDEELNQD